jgi:hypothetical protein
MGFRVVRVGLVVRVVVLGFRGVGLVKVVW